ncbi:MAG TPA: cellulase family glycosylhydrolase [Bryobacteraceae bacterium]|nr:cellulase family glycosylhydrolase [Bryobacteraceae bacterium]
MRWVASLLLLSGLVQAAPVNPERYAHLARGVNLTRWFQYGSYIPIDEAARDMLKAAGFTGVRIAVAPQYLLPNWAKPAGIDGNLAKLDRGIDMFLDAGMSVTLDFQADVDYLNYYLATPGAPGELIETWRMLAARYANRNPELLFFEIMNEPDTRFTQPAWDQVQKAALAAIRSVAPHHTVLLAPAGWSGLESLLRMKPYDDPNVIYVLHYYAPSTFTHQGATWTDQPGIAQLRSVPWPAWLPAPEQSDPAATERLAAYEAEDWDRSHIEWDMHLAAEWAREWNVSVIVNEFGAYKEFTAPDSRMRWMHDVRSAIEQQHFGWAVWDYAAGFDVTEMANGSRRIDPQVSAALGLTPWNETEPSRTPPPFTGPLEVQIGARVDTPDDTPDETPGPPCAIDASSDLVVTTSLGQNPVELFRRDGHGLLHPVAFEGEAPVVACAPIVAGHFDRSGHAGYFFPGETSRLALPSGDTLKQAALPALAAKAAIAGDIDRHGVDDIVLFGSQLELLHNGGNGNFRVVGNAFPALADHFTCGVLVKGKLLAFAPGKAAEFTRHGRDRFKPGKALQPSQGTGDCTAVAGPGEVIVGWSNDTIDIYGAHGERSTIPLAPSKNGVRRIALEGSTLVVTRPGEAPLFFARQHDGSWTPVDLKPANNLSVAAAVDLNGDGLTDFLYAQGGNAPLIARFARR